MSTLNDHLRNLLDEVPGVSARDFLKAWNREQRSVCQERRWRELRTQRQFSIGVSSTLGTGITNLPYSTGNVAGAVGATVLTSGGGANFLGEWNGLNHLQILIDGKDIYDVLAVNSVSETLTIWPALRTTYSGNIYQLFWIPGAMLPADMMGVRRISRLDTNRGETRLRDPDDYIMERVINGQPFMRLQQEESSDFIVHYVREPTAATGIGSTIDLPDYVQDLIYCRLLQRYIDRASMDQGIKSYMHAEAKERIARARKAAITHDEMQGRSDATNEDTLWIPSRYNMLR